MPPLDFSHVRPDLRLSVAIDFYMALRSMGTRSDVQFHVASRIFDIFKSEWRTMNEAAVVGLAGSFQYAREIFEEDGGDFLQDPVVMVTAHMFAYGMQNEQIDDVRMVKRVLGWAGPALKDFIDRVGIVRYPIRSLVATTAVYALPGRRQRPKELTRHGGGLAQGLTSPAPSDVSSLGSGVFPFGEDPAPSPPHWSMSAISVKEFQDLGLDGWIMLTDVQGREDGGHEGENEVLEAMEVDIEGTTKRLKEMSL
ncbi:uncharacterized protein N0V89_001526 [Didymosphaeria variabile]|uniref:Uncharacterized protein n=1 Tax=Didymosphaeria variabile TaxID=1932322 RepID=A0A9W8XYX0_9PLEO|nr:uncharacterized protein N0V89_001526 [Didymosphaeria variabile]KAJ4360957.1 hypothetical protein N0V89_001526 [Didymosphaeria variabile]